MLNENTIVRSQLIPLDNMRLILPNTSVAEVINYEIPAKIDEPPTWFMGLLWWRGLDIPLLKFETLACGKSVNAGRRSRIIVINAISTSAKKSFYGILTQGIPRLMSLNAEIIIDSPEQKLESFVLRNTLIDGNTAIIPDQEAMEAELNKIDMPSNTLQ
ncbi:MAG: chemotaxis protein CheW [Thiohalomonadales bacterium]